MSNNRFRGVASVVALVCLPYGVSCGLAVRQPSGSDANGPVENARQQEEISLAGPTGEQAKQGIGDTLAEPGTRRLRRGSGDAGAGPSTESVPGGGSPSADEGPVATAGPTEAGAAPGVGGTGLPAEVAGPVLEESRSGLGAVFPQCEGLRGEEARTCVEAGLAAFSATVAQGAAGEVREALQPWLLILTFGGGLLVAQLLFSFIALFMRRGYGGVAGLHGLQVSAHAVHRPLPRVLENGPGPRPERAATSEQQAKEEGRAADQLRGELLLTLDELERWRTQALEAQQRLGHLQEEKRELLRKVSGTALGLLALEGGPSRGKVRRRDRLLSLLLREGEGHAPSWLLTSIGRGRGLMENAGGGSTKGAERPQEAEPASSQETAAR